MTTETDLYTEQEIRERLSISTLVFYGFRPLSGNTLNELTQRQEGR